MNKTESLVEFFFKVKEKENPGKVYRKTITEMVSKLLDEGISESAIENAIIKCKDYMPGTPGVDRFDKYAREHRNEGSNNLIKKDVFYYHPALQIAPPPPVITINDDGTFSKSKQDFFLKMKEFFTFEDMLEYFYLRFPNLDRNARRDIAAMEYFHNKTATPMINTNGDAELNAVDLIMFTIDTASVMSQDMDDKVRKIFDLEAYLTEGLLVYSDKKEGCILAGINHVI